MIIKDIQWRKACKLGFMLVIIQVFFGTQTFAGDFNGRGSRLAWERSGTPYNDGVDLANAGKYEQSIAKFKEAISIYPYDADCFTSIAFSYFKRNKSGDLQRSADAYKQAVILSPNEWGTWSDYGRILADQGKYAEAQAAYRRCLQLHPPAKQTTSIKNDLPKLEKLKANTKAGLKAF